MLRHSYLFLRKLLYSLYSLYSWTLYMRKWEFYKLFTLIQKDGRTKLGGKEPTSLVTTGSIVTN